MSGTTLLVPLNLRSAQGLFGPLSKCRNGTQNGNLKMSSQSEMSATLAFEKYRDEVEAFENYSLASKVGSVSDDMIVGLGDQLDQWESYKNHIEMTEGSLASLGALPTIAGSVITAAYAQSLVPVIASVQTLDEEHSMIYHRHVTAESTRAGLNPGDSMRDHKDGSKNVYNADYASAATRGSFAAPLASIAAGDADVTFAVVPNLRPGTLVMEVVDDVTGVYLGKFIDDHQGNVLGNIGGGTVDYVTGVITVTLHTPAAADMRVVGSMQEDFEKMDVLPMIESTQKSMSVTAEVIALQMQYGKLQSYMMNKRFGARAAEQLSATLVDELTIAQNTRLVNELAGDLRGNTNFSTAPVGGESTIERRLDFAAAIAGASETIVANSGRGEVSYMVAGRQASVFLQSHPLFKGIEGGTAGNVALIGTMNGIPCIRSHNIIGDQEIAAGYKGYQNWDAALVVGNLIPLFIDDVKGDLNNGLKSSKVVASMASYDLATPTYTTKITLT